MKTTFLKSLTGVTATMLLAGYAGAQVTVPEVEGNETKAVATPASGLVSGDMRPATSDIGISKGKEPSARSTVS